MMMMMSGYDCLNKKRFSSRRKVDSELAATTSVGSRGVVGEWGDCVPAPLFSTGGTRPPLLHFFGLKFVQKLVHGCNLLLTETQCEIISVQQN